MRKTIVITLLSMLCTIVFAAGDPFISISFDATDGTGEVKPEEATSFSGSAPINVTFHYKLENVSPNEYKENYLEWKIVNGEETILNHDSSPTFNLKNSGTYVISFLAKFEKDGNIYDLEAENTLSITIYDSELEFPNAFSPNNDNKNDTYKPKSYKSIVDFRAIIFNRWGQKLYEWNDIAADGWDGTFNGTPVKQGVYFALIRAKGSDGKVYNIKKDINLFRSYDETYQDNGSSVAP